MYEEEALQMMESIRKLAAKPENLYNFGSYLTHHFREWLEKWASTPEALASELYEFATMEF